MIKLGDTVQFILTTRGADGRTPADETPTFDVYEGVTAIPIVVAEPMVQIGSSPRYFGSFVASEGNGFEAQKFYNIVGTAIVEGVQDDTVALTFKLNDADFDELEGLLAAIQSQTASVRITLTGPLSPDGRRMNLKKGDAYTVANGNEIKFRFKGKPDISDLELTDLKLGWGYGDGDPLLVLSAASKTGSADLEVYQEVIFELSASDNDTYLVVLDEPLEFDFVVFYPDSEPSTISSGPCTVSRRRVDNP